MTTIRGTARWTNVAVGLATAVLAGAASGQGATITGTVRSAQGQPLQAANVRIGGLSISVGTDANGVYRIMLSPERVRGQTVTLSARAIGYKPQSKSITVNAGTQAHDFALEFDVNRVSEVAVSDARVDTVRTTSGKQLAFTVDRADRSTLTVANDYSQHLYPPELIMQNQTRLRITEAQRNAILEEIYKVQATATQVQWRVADESEKLNLLLEREAPESEVIAQADRLMEWEGAVKRAQLTMLVRIRNLLTPEQKTMLRALRRRE